MKTLETPVLETNTIGEDNTVTLPLGLLGFERVKKYVLLSSPDEAPFMWFQVMDDPNLAFLVVSPFVVDPDYSPDISDEDVRFLGLNSPEDALLFNIVTVRGNSTATINLKGPIVINRFTLVGKQVIPDNANQYSVRHELAVE